LEAQHPFFPRYGPFQGMVKAQVLVWLVGIYMGMELGFELA